MAGLNNKASKLSLSFIRIFGLPEQEIYPNEVHVFEIPEDEVEPWVQKRMETINWKIEQLRVENSSRKQYRKRKEREAQVGAEPYPDAESRPKRGRPREFEWTEKYVCDHEGKYRDQRKADLSPSKRRPNRSHSSIRRGCTAHFWLRKRMGQTAVEISYAWKHNGHDPFNPEDMSSSWLSRRTREWIKTRVEEGLDWRAIKNLLRVDNTMMDKIEGGDHSEIPEALAVARTDVYNAIQRHMGQMARLDADGHKSLKKWREKLEKLDYAVIYQRVSVQAQDEQLYLFGFVSPWQKKLLLEYGGQIVCLDSTHNTCFSASGKEEKAFLYTIIVKNLATGKGAPAAFMITSSEAQYALSDWFAWLRHTFRFNPQSWMIDCSDVEAAAIRNIFAAALIWLCLWHVMKAVVDQSKKKLSVENPPHGISKAAANKQLRDHAVADFKDLISAESPKEFAETWDDIRSLYAEHPEWLKYLYSEWIIKKERWGKAWRKDIPHYNIDTNNYVESWHHHLKFYYLGLMRKQRLDVLLHILLDQVEPDFRQSEMRVALGFEQVRLSREELRRRKVAEEINGEVAHEMVQYMLNGEEAVSLRVESFAKPDIWYLIATIGELDNGQQDPLIASCACPAFVNTALTCKHMFLASRITGLTIRRLPPPVHNTSHRPPPSFVAAKTEEQVLTEKVACRGHVLDDLAKIRVLGDQLEKIRLEGVPRSDLLALEVSCTSLRRSLFDVVNSRALYGTQQA